MEAAATVAIARTRFRSVSEYIASHPAAAGSKGTIRFPLSRPVPARLIERIARLRAKEAAERARARSARLKTRP